MEQTKTDPGRKKKKPLFANTFYISLQLINVFIVLVVTSYEYPICFSVRNTPLLVEKRSVHRRGTSRFSTNKFRPT